MVSSSSSNRRGIERRLLAHITEFFLQSRDFNGIAIERLAGTFGLSQPELRRFLGALVRKGHVTLAFGSHSGNPHILRLDPLPLDEQLARFKSFLESGEDDVCAYPTPAVLERTVSRDLYADRPFRRRLVLGEAQLTPVFVELRVLERYQRDPRYNLEFRDYEGSLSLKQEFDERADTEDRDKVFLETFGIAYDEGRHRVIMAFLRYLADLSPEHQQFWMSFLVSRRCRINGDYARATIRGEWPEHYSVYEALLAEQEEINKLSNLIRKPPLFRELFGGRRPAGLHPLLLPTKRNYQEFGHLLDKMLSENLNRDFFRDDIPLEERIELRDGGTEVRPKSTITLLRDWFDAHYTDQNNRKVGNEVVAPLREIRQLRQEPAHTIRDDEYDLTYTDQQDDLLSRAVRSLTKIRLVLSSHPHVRAAGYKSPDWLDGEIVIY